MQLTPEKLQQQNFMLLEKVEHAEFNAFMRKHSWNSSIFKVAYFMIVLLFSVMTIGLIIQSKHPIIQRILFASLGVLIALILIPFHEYIHYLVYKHLGATNVKITSYWSQGYVLTKADQFVVSKKEIKWIASAPFLIISAIGIMSFFFLTDLWQISVCSMILFHATLCYNDFRILDYFLVRDSDIYMYDYVQEGVTYFYKR